MSAESVRPWLRVSAADGAPLGAIFGGIGLLAAGAVALLGIDRLPLSICFLKALTGIPCPTCGATRALAHLIRLDPAGAFAMNPLAASAALVIAAWALADLALLPSRRAFFFELAPGPARLVRAVAVAALAANWLYLVAAGR